MKTPWSELPEELLRSRIGSGPVTYRHKSFDVGMVQLDSIRVDLPATLARSWKPKPM